MSLMLEEIRLRCGSPAEAFRWSCVLEVTAPKVGNVYPGRPFDDLCFLDFVRAAELSAASFDDRSESYGASILSATQNAASHLKTNVNLGIVLLMGPLVVADGRGSGGGKMTRAALQQSVCEVLDATTPQDARHVYQAIGLARPGGMGQVREMDVAGPAPDDLIEAMRQAAPRDRIAMNFADGYSDLFGTVVPTLADCVMQQTDILGGISRAHLQLLAEAPDSLIQRKFGVQVAEEVQQRARLCLQGGAPSQDFDAFLRTPQQSTQGASAPLNPGTTADLIAAGLYVLLRTLD